ncbi:MAG: 23S rRNA (adenine(2503)-C(2))-methyltransferase RlmN [Chthoniobacteraceae bacterium]|nr:23S rRNA (adenine(2503)-C(2))-methyltransferase RlmN [Chthoniobacteraceae bacterium]
MSATNSPRSLHDLPFPALEEALTRADVRPIHTRALWRALHREAALDLQTRADFLPPLRRWVEAHTAPGGPFFLDTPQAVADLRSTDGHTRKFLLRLRDGQTVETVLMAYPGRSTACVSTQAGCAMGCTFCATGKAGFTRHLRPGEIVAQVLHCQRILRDEGKPGLRNLVLMGMGEPLHNYDAVMTALEILTDRRGTNIGPAHVTLSTVGVIPGILRLARENSPYALALSLHAATDAERRVLIPASRRWPLADLLGACRTYCHATGRRIFIEWTLIAGVNDTPSHARQLAAALEGIAAHVNLIPLNPTAAYAGAPTASAPAQAFKGILQAAGFPSTLRQRRGIDIAAGCGQLRGALQE